MCLGLLALKNLRVNQIPDVEQPVIVVNIPYPGASPETVEREIVNRVEKSLQSIPQVYQIRSTAAESNASIVIIFNFKKNMVEASDEIRNAIASVRHKLPVEMREPILQRIDPSAQPIMQLALSSTTQTHAEISRLAEDVLADRFRGIDGVAVVNVNGALRRELSVLLRAEKLREYNVSVTDVVNALRAQNTTAPVGRVKGPLDEQSIRLVGRIESPAEFEQIVAQAPRQRGGAPGRRWPSVADGFAELASFSLRNGHPNVGISVTRSRDASTVTVADEGAQAGRRRSTRRCPAGTKLEVTQDGGEDAEASLKNVIEALVFGAVLTIFVVYAFLNSWRSTLITALSLPTSVIAAFIAVWACGFTLNFMTLLGLSLAIGVLIDDAIVVRENIVRHMERGADRMTAARAGTAEIGLAVTATTFSIIAVFIPVAFMGGGAGEWFRPFALTVATSVLVSLFISFTLDPMLSAYWGDPVGYQQQEKKGIAPVAGALQRLVRPPGRPLRQRDRLGAAPPPLDDRSSRWRASWARSRCRPRSAARASCRPPTSARSPSRCARPRAPAWTTRRLKVEKAAELARTLPETKATNSQVNASGGRVYVDIGKSTKRKRSRRRDRRGPAQAHGAAGRRRVRRARRPQQRRAEARADPVLRARIRAGCMAITSDFMEKLTQGARARSTWACRSRSPRTSCKIELDRGLANSLGISVGDAAQALRVAFAGVEVGDWVDPDGRVARRRRAPAPGRPRGRDQHRAPAHRGDRQQHDGAAGPDRDHHHGQGPGADPALRRQAHDRGVGQRAGPLARRGDRRRAEDREADRVPARLRPGAGRRLARPAGGVLRDGHRAGDGHRAHVPGAGDAVRLLHRAAAGDAVAAALASSAWCWRCSPRAARSTS